MSTSLHLLRRGLLWGCVAILFVSPVLAEKPSRDGGAKHHPKSHSVKKHDDFRRHDGDEQRPQQFHQQRPEEHRTSERFFDDHHRHIVNSYYRDEFQRGSCPPGLAKKHNGCLPPGQAKRWTLGQPLPRDVIYYDLPDTVVRQIGYPPPGYRLVRVASDVLMIAIGTGMVVDALTDLNVLP